MKIKRIMAALLAGVVAAAAVVAVSAETTGTKELTDVTPENSTEVTAKIVNPGSVSYVITIPEKADFGNLTQPDSVENDNFTFQSFQIEATELNILSNQAVTVYMKDKSSTDDQFYISQKEVADPFTIAYDVYDTTVNEGNVGSYDPINATATPGSYGYHVCTFAADAQGSKQNVTLALNQNALYGETLSDIAGDYSGTILFHSALVQLS